MSYFNTAVIAVVSREMMSTFCRSYFCDERSHKKNNCLCSVLFISQNNGASRQFKQHSQHSHLISSRPKLPHFSLTETTQFAVAATSQTRQRMQPTRSDRVSAAHSNNTVRLSVCHTPHLSQGHTDCTSPDTVSTRTIKHA